MSRDIYVPNVGKPYFRPEPIGGRILIGHRWVTRGEFERYRDRMKALFDQIDEKLAVLKAEREAGGAK
jgi:hypothetical protein